MVVVSRLQGVPTVALSEACKH